MLSMIVTSSCRACKVVQSAARWCNYRPGPAWFQPKPGQHRSAQIELKVKERLGARSIPQNKSLVCQLENKAAPFLKLPGKTGFLLGRADNCLCWDDVILPSFTGAGD
jgi:hypothetical protein